MPVQIGLRRPTGDLHRAGQGSDGAGHLGDHADEDSEIDRRELGFESELAATSQLLDEAIYRDRSLQVVGRREVEGDLRDRQRVVLDVETYLRFAELDALTAADDADHLRREMSLGVREIVRGDLV